MREKKAQKVLQDVKKTYNAIAEDFSNTRKSLGKDFKQLLPYLHDRDYLVDVGCGNGRLISFLNENKDAPRIKYLGIDNNKNLLQLAKKNNPNNLFIEGDQLDLPLENDSVDILTNIRSFHHLPSKKYRLNSLREMKRVLKSDGTLIITVWNLWQIKYLKQLIFASLRALFTFGSYDFNDTFIPWGKKFKRYYHAFTLSELESVVKLVGFKIIRKEKLGHDYLLIAEK